MVYGSSDCDERNGDAVADRVGEVVVVGEALEIRYQRHAAVSNLQVVGAGHVRHRCPPRVLRVPAVCPVLRAIYQVGNASVRGAAGGALFRDACERARRVARALVRTERGLVGTEARFEQHAIGRCVRPGDLPHARMGIQILANLRRRRRAETTQSERTDAIPRLGLLPTPILVGGERRTIAGNLFVPVHVELVTRGRLNRQTHRVQTPALGTKNFLGEIGQIERLGSIARIQVGEDVRNYSMLSFITRSDAVPQTVLDDWAADAEGEVPLFVQLARRRQTSGPQLVAVVAPHHATGYAGQIEVAADRVAAALRDDAERGATDFGFAQST